MASYVALLRGINVGGHRKVPMANLREVACSIGLTDPRTYVASGNLLFRSEETAPALEARLENAIQKHFGFDVDVIVRSADQWAVYRSGNPFLQESEKQPNLVMMTLGKRPATEEDVEKLRQKAGGNERVERVGDAIWIWFGDGAGRSKIGTGPTSRDVWTTRNWRTVATLAGLLGA
jgi:uncharacterized protein (DUF1697 family)